MDRTIKLMAGAETVPAETPSGGTLSTDFGEQLILLGNRLTAIETAIAKLTKQLDRETETEPDTETPAEQDTETETPAEAEPETEQETEPESPAESEENTHER